MPEAISPNNLMARLVGPAAAAGPTGTADAVAASVLKLSLDDLEDNPFQPREDYDAQKMSELVRGIKQDGQLQPIAVRRTPAAALRPGSKPYQVVYGHRRMRAMLKLRDEGKRKGDTNAERQWGTIQAIVKELDDVQMARMALKENLDRAELNPVEAAAGLWHVMQTTGKSTAKEAAEVAGISQERATVLLRVYKAPACVKAGASAGVEVELPAEEGETPVKERRRLDLYQALEFAKLFDEYLKKDPKKAEAKTEKAIARALRENWGVRRIQSYVANIKAGKKEAEADTAQERPRVRSGFKLSETELHVKLDAVDALQPTEAKDLVAALEALLARAKARAAAAE